MEHLRDFGGGEHLAQLIQCHRAHPVVAFREVDVEVGASDPRDDPLRRFLVVDPNIGSGQRVAKPYFGPVRGSTLRGAYVRRSNDRAGPVRCA
jgi:hypothetical protein